MRDVTNDKTIDDATEVSKSAVTAKNNGDATANPSNSNGSSFKNNTNAKTKKVVKK